MVYDPRRDAWSRGPVPPNYRPRVRRFAVHGDVHGNQTLVPIEEVGPGRRLPFELPNGAADALGRIFWFSPVGPVVFDPRKRAWEQPPPPVWHQREQRHEGPVPVYARTAAATAVSPDGEFYLLGGLGGKLAEGGPQPYELLRSVDIYDPAQNRWSVAPPMRRARQLFSAAFGADGKLYVFGGYGHKGSVEERPDESAEAFDARVAEMTRLGSQVLDAVEAYDPRTRTWAARAPLPVGLEGTGAALGADGRIYVVGGTRSYSKPVARREVYAYDPTADAWSEARALHTERQGHAVVATPEGRIYAIGGTNAHPVASLSGLLGAGQTRGAPLASVEVVETVRPPN